MTKCSKHPTAEKSFCSWCLNEYADNREKQTLEEVLKEFSERDKEGEIVDTCEYMPYKKIKFQKWLEQKLKEAME